MQPRPSSSLRATSQGDALYPAYFHNPVGMWSAGIDSQARNLSGSSRVQGTLGGTAVELFKGRRVWNLNGSTDHITFGSPAIYDLTGGSCAMWYHPTSSIASDQILVGKDESGTNSGDMSYGIRRNSASNPDEIKMFHQSEATIFSSNLAVNFGVWNHVVFSWGALGRFAYMDGVLQNTDAVTSGWTNVSAPLIIGAQRPTSDNFPGRISDFLLWDTILSAGEVAELYRITRRDHTEVFRRRPSFVGKAPAVAGRVMSSLVGAGGLAGGGGIAGSKGGLAG